MKEIIKCSLPYKNIANRELDFGDIVNLKGGETVRAIVKKKFVYTNKPKDDTLDELSVVVGKVYLAEDGEKYVCPTGKYVVTAACLTENGYYYQARSISDMEIGITFVLHGGYAYSLVSLPEKIGNMRGVT